MQRAEVNKVHALRSERKSAEHMQRRTGALCRWISSSLRNEWVTIQTGTKTTSLTLNTARRFTLSAAAFQSSPCSSNIATKHTLLIVNEGLHCDRRSSDISSPGKGKTARSRSRCAASCQRLFLLFFFFCPSLRALVCKSDALPNMHKDRSASTRRDCYRTEASEVEARPSKLWINDRHTRASLCSPTYTALVPLRGQC